MPRISEWYFKVSVVFLIVGIGVGLQMSISGNHNVTGAHAHLNLVGWVTSALFGAYYALNPAKAEGRLPIIQFGVYTVGVVIMVIALYFLLQGNTALTPLVAAGSIIAFIGVLIFAVVVFGGTRRA